MTPDSITDAVLSVPTEAAQPAPPAAPEAPASPSVPTTDPGPGVVEAPQSEGFHGRMTLEAQTVRRLLRLRVRRNASVEQLLDGEACPIDEQVQVVAHNWKEGGKSWGRVSILPGPGGLPPWWGPKHQRACDRWIRAFKWLIDQRLKEHNTNRMLDVGTRGKSRRW